MAVMGMMRIFWLLTFSRFSTWVSRIRMWHMPAKV
ncbi:hypothetical protein L861_09785 [Litchfieldella anticariensis FP35 = DSM 16096]|uniref:Uncharacterized protein n=1 Tax=Litchfieldella anticariensis (strain DSM 16096 / CECT 5854 / CIP 108499 / LMG 22089 / FP35) TaxID=1121939 RepID=S2L4H5_LITA3|nr:hypothetical protein L861_09785 [Halomonas anticariensis FP35 = DSM 16096]